MQQEAGINNIFNEILANSNHNCSWFEKLQMRIVVISLLSGKEINTSFYLWDDLVDELAKDLTNDMRDQFNEESSARLRLATHLAISL